MRRPPMHQDWQIIIVGGGVKELGMLSVSAPGHRRVRRARCEAETEGDPPARRCRSGARFLSRFSIFQRFAARKISLASPEPRFPARPWIVSLFTPAARGDRVIGRFPMAERRRRFQFYIERFQSARRLFLSTSTLSFLRLVSRSCTVSRAPMYHILWVLAFLDHTISRPGFNLFKLLRRHFRATPFCRQPLEACRPTFRLPARGRAAAKAALERRSCNHGHRALREHSTSLSRSRPNGTPAVDRRSSATAPG